VRTPEEHAIGTAVIGLMRGVVYRESDEARWNALGRHAGPVRDHFAAIGVHVVIDDVEGYAYLRTVEPEDGEEPLPRLVNRRALTYNVSLLLVLLASVVLVLPFWLGYDPAAEGIALGPDGLVSEGSGQNVILVRDGVLITPATDGTLLLGITRDCVIKLAQDLDLVESGWAPCWIVDWPMFERGKDGRLERLGIRVGVGDFNLIQIACDAIETEPNMANGT
jgi:hypothetical protein